jgi:hypothetical protein
MSSQLQSQQGCMILNEEKGPAMRSDRGLPMLATVGKRGNERGNYSGWVRTVVLMARRKNPPRMLI